MSQQIMSQKKKDALPWTEVFRPMMIADVVSNDTVKKTLTKYIETKFVPHLLLYGPSGTGKTSTIRAFARELYGVNYPIMVMEINASEERGIEVVRNKIKQFVITKCPIYNAKCPFKLVILDEADSMTTDAQSMLRRVIENHTENARFCLLCNKIKNIDPAIQSRCTPFRFSPLTTVDITGRMKFIAEKKNISLTASGIETIIKISKGDMRKVINVMQATAMAYKTIDRETVVSCMGYPHISDIEQTFESLCTKRYNDAYNDIKNIKDECGYSLLELITELQHLILDRYLNKKVDDELSKFITDDFVINVCSKLKDIEMNLIFCPNDNIQLAGIVSIFVMHR